MSNRYCPNCSCPSCQPIEDGYEEENKELRRKILRLESHVISQDKLIAEMSPEETAIQPVKKD